MAEGTDARVKDGFAPEISSRNLPPVTYRDLPEPLRLRNAIGPGVILVAAGLGSGEYVLWPFIASQAGLVFMWAAVVGVLTQTFILLEVGRYTLATGETAVTGFTRLWKPWWWLFVLMAILPNAWPGFTTGASTTLTFALGGGNVLVFTILGLIAIGLSLTLSPVVYQFLEKFQTVMVVIIITFLVLAVIFGTRAQAWGDLIIGFSNFGRIPGGIEPSALAAAIAFAGSGGAALLVVSNYIRDKQMGMGAHIPRLVSPITGQDEARAATGYMFPQDEANLARWKGWWKVTNQEQFLTFFLIGTVGIIVMSVLAYSTVFDQNVGEDFDFIRAEGEVLSEAVAPWFGTFFWLSGTVILFSTNLGNFDWVSRLTADALKVNWLRESEFWSESKIYALTVWVMVTIGVLILFSGLQQPLVLLVIAAVLNGLVMFLYSALLIWLNRRALPAPIKIRGLRLLMMIWAVLFFGFFSIFVIWDQVQQLFGG